MRIHFSRTLVWMLAFPATIVAQENTVPSGATNAAMPPAPEAWPAPAPPVISPLPDGRIDIGGVIVDPETRTATLPVKLNLDADLITDAATGLSRVSGEPVEYLLVHENGKAHESIFTTTVRPWALHTAMLLLGLEKAPRSASDVKAPSAIDDAFLATAPLPEGVAVEIELPIPADLPPAPPVPAYSALFRWKVAWDAVHEIDADSRLPQGAHPWTYNGSYFIQQAFIAEVDGSFISLITDPAALINSTHPLRINDDNWRTNPSLHLKIGDPAQLVFRFPQDLPTAQDSTHDETP